MQVLSLDYTGLALIALAAVLFLLEVYVVSYGLLTLAAVICMVLGSVMLVRSGSELSNLSLGIAIFVSIVTSALCACLAYIAAQSQNVKRVSGYEQLMRETGVSQSEVTTEKGRIRVHSELWQARCKEGAQTIAAGVRVRVIEHRGLTLIVEAIANENSYKTK